MNLGTARLRGRPRNRWQDGVREDERIVGGEGWWEKVLNREEWKKLLRTTRNRQILHMPMEWMNMKGYRPTCCKSMVHWCTRETGRLPMCVARNTCNNCSFCAGFSTRAYDSATAENQLDSGSTLNSPPHNSWPVVRFATATGRQLHIICSYWSN